MSRTSAARMLASTAVLSVFVGALTAVANHGTDAVPVPREPATTQAPPVPHTGRAFVEVVLAGFGVHVQGGLRLAADDHWRQRGGGDWQAAEASDFAAVIALARTNGKSLEVTGFPVGRADAWDAPVVVTATPRAITLTAAGCHVTLTVNAKAARFKPASHAEFRDGYPAWEATMIPVSAPVCSAASTVAARAFTKGVLTTVGRRVQETAGRNATVANGWASWGAADFAAQVYDGPGWGVFIGLPGVGVAVDPARMITLTAGGCHVTLTVNAKAARLDVTDQGAFEAGYSTFRDTTFPLSAPVCT